MQVGCTGMGKYYVLQTVPVNVTHHNMLLKECGGKREETTVSDGREQNEQHLKYQWQWHTDQETFMRFYLRILRLPTQPTNLSFRSSFLFSCPNFAHSPLMLIVGERHTNKWDGSINGIPFPFLSLLPEKWRWGRKCNNNKKN
uniref:Uncharacterized protein n=1 Tax=Trypanosoma vivax (strain Y486) TaxID=1055687 RepID=G0TU67_TRYVY|nr:hypothetical protein, unlikely [Trypanosoma vivax Y486]